ncbi:hypothetical protein BVX98_06640 [bacterium F11]|nr:hypothetical protein BVX98_06640 [bacterium F11]
MKLRTKLTLSLILLVTLVVMGVGGITILSERANLKLEVDKQHQQLVTQLGKVCEESLYQSPILFSNYGKTLKREKAFRSASFVDLNNIIRLHSDPKMMGSSFQSNQEEKVKRLTQRVMFEGKSVGTVHLTFDLKDLSDHYSDSLRVTLRRVSIISCGVFVVAFFLALVIANNFVHPIHRIVRGMKRVSEGELEPIRFPSRSDELGWMGREINHTISKLKELDQMKRDFVAALNPHFLITFLALPTSTDIF